jgi:hypothetical protein
VVDYSYHYHHLGGILNIIMTIDSKLNKVLSVIGLQHASKDAIVKGLLTREDLKDLFTELADNKSKVETAFRLVVDTSIVNEIDIHRVMFVFGIFWQSR